MVSGVVRPPALELANRDLVQAHLHAVWLAEAGIELPNNIPELLDRSADALPLRDDISAHLRQPDLMGRASAAMEKLLGSMRGELTSDKAPWAADPQKLAASVAAEAFAQFDRAFDRWRRLTRGARVQLMDANRRSECAWTSADDRREGKAPASAVKRADPAVGARQHQRKLGLFITATSATERFLPGYNFPRLPLYTGTCLLARGRRPFCNVPGSLAIAEFGPRSLVYHEGRAYRVFKAKLPPEARDAEGRLVTRALYVCADCGASHEEMRERCHACGASMTGMKEITHVLRIDNVERPRKNG